MKIIDLQKQKLVPIELMACLQKESDKFRFDSLKIPSLAKEVIRVGQFNTHKEYYDLICVRTNTEDLFYLGHWNSGEIHKE